MVTVNGNRVAFHFFRPSAARVCLIGEFNDWRDGLLPMTVDSEGYWRASLCLPPGNYRFRYISDGQAFADYASFGLEPGPFGYDSVVSVGQAPAVDRCDSECLHNQDAEQSGKRRRR